MVYKVSTDICNDSYDSRDIINTETEKAFFSHRGKETIIIMIVGRELLFTII